MSTNNTKLGRIFDAITPDNIKEVPVIRDAMQVFLETLEEMAAASIDINNIYDNPAYRDNLRQMYLNDLYNVLKKLQLNDQIDAAIDRINAQYGEGYIKKNRVEDLDKFLTEEHFFSFKSYKQSKGTAASIQYIYELLSGLVMSSETKSDFRIVTNGKPFEFSVEGSLPTEVYEELVFPLAHPLGFNYVYERYMFEQLQDFFPYLRVVYNTRVAEVRSLFPDGSTDVDPYINKTIPLEEQIELGLDPDLMVTNVADYSIGETRVRDVFLSNGTYLRQTSSVTGQTQVQLLQGTGEESDEVIRTYDGQSSIFLDYTPVILTSIEDSIVTSTNTDYQVESVGRADEHSESNVPSFQDDIDELAAKDLDLGVIPTSAFESQNVGNEGYFAREHERTSADLDWNETESHVELDSSEQWMLINDDQANVIGDFWVTWKEIEVFADGDSYLQLDKFHQDSDSEFYISVFADDNSTGGTLYPSCDSVQFGAWEVMSTPGTISHDSTGWLLETDASEPGFQAMNVETESPEDFWVEINITDLGQTDGVWIIPIDYSTFRIQAPGLLLATYNLETRFFGSADPDESEDPIPYFASAAYASSLSILMNIKTGTGATTIYVNGDPTPHSLEFDAPSGPGKLTVVVNKDSNANNTTVQVVTDLNKMTHKSLLPATGTDACGNAY